MEPVHSKQFDKQEYIHGPRILRSYNGYEYHAHLQKYSTIKKIKYFLKIEFSL